MKTPSLKWPAAYSLARSEDSRLLACLGRNVVVIDMENRVRISTSHPLSHPSHAAFSPDGERLAVKATNGRIVISDPHAGGVLQDYENQNEGEGSEVQFSPDGDELVDGSWEGILTVRRVSDGVPLIRRQYPGEMVTRISHDRARRLWLVQHSPKVRRGENMPAPDYVSLHHWPLEESNSRKICFGMHIRTAELSPDGSRFCFIQRWDQRRIHIARVSDGQIIATSAPIEGGGTGDELAWSTDSKFIGAVADGMFVFCRANDLAIVGRKVAQYPSSVMFMRGGDEIVLGSWNTSMAVNFDAVIDEQ